MPEPEIDDRLAVDGLRYAIRRPAERPLEERIAHLPTREATCA